MSGHQFLINEVGIKEDELPKVSWQLDSFGVSKGYSRLVKDMGMDVQFFTRIDIQEKKQML